MKLSKNVSVLPACAWAAAICGVVYEGHGKKLNGRLSLLILSLEQIVVDARSSGSG